MQPAAALAASALLAIALTAPAGARAASGSANGPEARTASAVQAADDAWGAAEAQGKAAFVDQLLAPGYRSIGPDGKTTDKAAIVAHARAFGKSPERAAKVAAWKAAHPSRAVVTLFGDTAVLNWVSTKAGEEQRIYSCDIFVYRGGHWRAIYSQHTDDS